MTITGLAVHSDWVAYLQGEPEALTVQVRALSSPGRVRVLVEGIRCSLPYQRLIWHPGGARLFYAADDGRWLHEIWQVDVDGSPPQQLTDYFYTNSVPVAINPDGGVLLSISNLRGEHNIRKLDMTNGDFRKITDYASPVRSAVYDPTGERIAYTANSTLNRFNTDIYIMDADGFDKRLALSTLAGAFDTVRDWSADGHLLAVDSNVEGGRQAGIFDLRDGDLRWFTPVGQTAQAAAFSPDGRYLLTYTPVGLWAFDVQGEGDVALSPASVSSAAWIDAQRVVFGTDDDRLFTVSVQNPTPTPLTNG